jgi:hypothetical protein
MDMLLAMEEEMAVPIAGKRRKMPIILFIYKQFLRKAASGDVRCMSKAIELRRQLIAERANQQLSLMQELLGAEKACAENPEDVTDKLIEAMRRAREALDDDYKLH